MNAFAFVSGVLWCLLGLQQFLKLPKNIIEIGRFREGATHLGGFSEDGTGNIVRPDSRKSRPDFTRELQHMCEYWGPCQVRQPVNHVMYEPFGGASQSIPAAMRR